MSAKSRNLPGRKPKYKLSAYLKAGLSATQAKKARRLKLNPTIVKANIAARALENAKV